MTKTRMTSSTNVAPEGAWRKSSYSNEQGGNCVEIADLSAQIGIRDSKDKAGPALVVTAEAFTSFVTAVRAGEFGEV